MGWIVEKHRSAERVNGQEGKSQRCLERMLVIISFLGILWRSESIQLLHFVNSQREVGYVVVLLHS